VGEQRNFFLYLQIRKFKLMNMKIRILIGVFFLISCASFGQNCHQNYLQGYAGDVGGKNFGYHPEPAGINRTRLEPRPNGG
jgi:hypothetical protein